MSLTPTNITFKNKGKDIKYLNKDFSAFRDNLIEFAKTYFPKTHTDFSAASPGMMFIEMASYIGDVLSYYVDDTYKESLMTHATDEGSVMALAQYLGYKPKVASPSVTTLSIYQIVPSIGSGATNLVDDRFCLKIKEGMQCQSNNGINFITTEAVDFGDETNREVSIYQTDGTTGEPTLYLLKKYVKAISGTLVTEEFTFGSYEAFRTITLEDTNVIQIVDVRDSNNNKYYEVPYLAQEMVFVEYPNISQYDEDLYQFKSTVPYILKTIKTSKRYTTKINADRTTTIQFGAGDPSASDELLIPNLKNVGLGLPNSINRLEESFDPTNFLKTKTYGTSPSNTTITVKYLSGGGISSNVGTNEIRRITGIEFDEDIANLNQSQISTYRALKSTIAIDNEISATGGKGSDTLEEIRQNALANFGSQNRAVTSKDYQVRALSMPTKFGSVAKAYAAADGILDNNSPSSILASPNNLQEFTNLVMSFVNKPDDEEPNESTVQEEIKKFLIGKTSNEKEKNNPFAINLYLLGYDDNNNLVPLNRAVKENLKTYLTEYKMLTDGVNMIDGFVVNIGVEFEIVVYQNYNKQEVVTNCISELTSYFSIDNWTFNQTINLNEVELVLASVEGVSSVSMLSIKNKCGGLYSPNSYNIEAATKDNIIYPSLDPSIFEVKYPSLDIRGRAR